MIKSLTVTNHLGESTKIVLRGLDSSGLLITKIEGIGPGKATINSIGTATGDGTIINSSRLEARQIVISMRFKDLPDVETNRHNSYRYFPIKQKVTLVFETDSRFCGIDGIVEANEPDIFSDKSGCMVTINCPDPYFYSAYDDGLTVTSFGSIESRFEFPFSNESLTDPMIEFSKLEIKDYNNIVYSGDAPVGVILTITALGNIGNVSIENIQTGELMTIRTDLIKKITGSELQRNDTLEISTIRNKKYVILTRSGKRYNVLNALDRYSNWFELRNGDNLFTYKISKGDVYFTISNRTLYSGV